MEDSAIVKLYFDRDQSAVTETKNKYGYYCYTIAYNILQNREDSEESVNDTYIGAWNAIPPHKPLNLGTFLGKLTRRISLKKLRTNTAQKRGGDNKTSAFYELEECIPSDMSIEKELEAKELTTAIDRFLETLSVSERRVFLCRYWYFESIEEISKRFGFGQSKVKMILKRTRDRLTSYLKKEGFLA